MQKNAPDFIGIGADHAGLGSITALLADHPAVVDAIPSCRFFSQEGDPTEVSLQAYESQLPPLDKKHRLRGECSAEYLATTSAAERIVTAYPTTKLFVVVRHPLDRAIAVYEHARQSGHIPSTMSCADYLLAHPLVQTDGFYGHHLSAYFSYYTALQLHIIVYEDFATQPLKVMQDLYGFLEIDTNFVPKALAAFAPPPDEPINPGRIKRLILFIGQSIKKMRAKPAVPITPPPYVLSTYFSETEQAVFTAAYEPDCAQLTNIMHRDIGVFWNIVPPNKA